MDDEPELWQDQQRLYNFLKHYDLLHYHKKFLEKGVRRLSHLKDVAADDASLDEIGLTRPERLRLRKKVKENVEWMGKFKKRIARKQNRFDEPAPQVAHTLMEMENQSRTAAIITRDQITLGQRIGEGAHGSVFEGTWANIHGSVAVAVKTLYGRQEAQGQFIKEANSMCSLNHRHIIQLYGIVLSHPLMLVEELAPFGSLYKYLKQNGKTLNLESFQVYATQIAEAMKYLEGRRIVHRDLATRNILLTSQNYVKLSDFGMARVLDDNSEVYNLSNLGARIPIAWTAPEALTRAKFSTASDVWSYGVVLWEIYSLCKIPWDGLSPIEIRDLLLRGERLARPSRCPLDMYEAMLECWEPDPHERPTFAVLVQRLESIVCQKVRALKAHIVDDDEDSLSFKNGELIFLIDKPKPGWMFGMTEDGNIGHFQSEYVTTYLDPVGDLKEKLTNKKAKASGLSISGPTDIDHMVHVGSDGNKWVSENSSEKDLSALGHSPSNTGTRRVNGVESVSPSNSSGSCPASPPFKVIKSPSPGAQAPDSPLLQHQQPPLSPTPVVSNGTGAAGPLTPQPYLYPVASELKTGEPIFGEITHGDTKFIGKIRYVPHKDMKEKEEGEIGEQGSSKDGEVPTGDLINLSSDSSPPPTPPHRSYKRLQSEDNQYISMSRSATLNPEVLGRLREGTAARDGSSPEPEDGGDPMGAYMTMRSYPVHLQKQLANVREGREGDTADVFAIGMQREVAPSYGVISRQRIQSAPGESRHLIYTSDHDEDNQANVFDPLRQTKPGSATAAAPTFPSQYSFATATLSENSKEQGTKLAKSSNEEEALVPSSVRFIYQRPTATSTASTSAAGVSVGGVGRDDITEQQAPPIPERPRHGHISQSLSSASTPPLIQRGKLMSEGETGGAVGVSRSPVIPPRPHPPNHRHETSSGSSVNLSPQAKAKKPPMPPPRVKSNTAPRQEVPPRSPRLSPSHDIVVRAGGGGGGKTAAKLSDTEMKIQTLILSDPEFQGCSPDVCLKLLRRHGFDMSSAKEDMRVHMLMEMKIEHIVAEDCKRALSHCQQKLDRAAEWLLEQSLDIERRKQ